MMDVNIYPVLINGKPWNVEVRSQRTAFDANGTFIAIPNTIALSFENQGATVVTLDGVFVMAVGSPAYNLGGDLYARRSDEITIAFTGAGVNSCIVTQDVFIRFVSIEDL